MEKVLRSLIHERFPLELRVEIDLMSRRRDISNEEKQEEIIKLLEKYDVYDYVRLGPGTNRYAFKLDGFVVKVATDHDGKIDNLKEFKMAKRLFPYVANTYEVSENGTLLVAEYVPPFETFQEMCMYSDQILDILRKLSSVYLIGDVGIASKNYSNWGIRVGTNDPVCLDFAYVYEVSSALFVCRHCKSNSILVPYDNFNSLICPNPSCNHVYKFEDIRAKLGNDIHRHAIGDLSEEGYRMTESGVKTTLTEDRSNYLATERNDDKKKKKKKKRKSEEVASTTTTKEETNMNDFSKGFTGAPLVPAPIILAGVSTPTKESDKFKGIEGESFIPSTAEPPVSPQTPNGQIAFSCNLKPDVIELVGVSEPVKPEPAPIMKETVHKTPVKPPVVEPVLTVTAEPEAEEVSIGFGEDDTIPEDFAIKIHDALSMFSNSAERYMQRVNLLHRVKDHISRKKKVFGDREFYRPCQNTVFRAIAAITGQVEDSIPRDDNPELSRKVYVLTEIPPETSSSFPTIMFLYRCWKYNLIDDNEDLRQLMSKYREKFNDFMGIQPAWQHVFEVRIRNKIPIDAVGAKQIGDILSDLFCAEEIPEPPVAADPETMYAESTDTDQTEVPESDLDKCGEILAKMHEKYDGPGEFNMNDMNRVLIYCTGCAGHVYTVSMNMIRMVLSAMDNDQYLSHIEYSNVHHAAESLENDIGDMYTLIERAIDALNPAESDDSDPDLSGSFTIDDGIAGDDEDDDYDDDEDDDDDESEATGIRVEITRYKELDRTHIIYTDDAGVTSIPIYATLGEIDTEQVYHSMVDDRNGDWDWLINFEPILAFRTQDPEKWLNASRNIMDETGTNLVIVIIGHQDNGDYIMGVYPYDGIYLMDEDGEPNLMTHPTSLATINRIVGQTIGSSNVSFLRWHYTNEILSEEEISMPGINDSDNVIDNEPMDPAMMAAAAVLVGKERVEEYTAPSEQPLVPPTITAVAPEAEPDPEPEAEKEQPAPPSQPVTIPVVTKQEEKPKDPNTFFKPIRKKSNGVGVTKG